MMCQVSFSIDSLQANLFKAQNWPELQLAISLGIKDRSHVPFQGFSIRLCNGKSCLFPAGEDYPVLNAGTADHW